MNKEELFTALNPSISYQREIEGLLKDISKRDNITEKDILARDEIKNIMTKDTPRNQKITEIKKTLKKWRLPQLSETQENFDSEVQNLKLSKNIRIIPPQNFEGDYLTLEIRIKKKESINNAIKELQRIENEIQTLLDYM